ncbi:HAMP domain-containing histidine kinase [Geomonas nitrogeniifigens]|uniref:sensor histidine kinase n=1 Tax=Geomonas diazotrophica TaxID=2843197 RepID=UPI001C2C5D0E|nr:HAMP domain-containing sensor histidine kinase [Geomonas nitrogeniifigens]QXE86621.1 HAMP domain-containing histidine kinase [Geomonas nitrogeniifigens]
MIRSLYLKILLHWCVALALTEALVFVLFLFVVGESHRQYVTKSVAQSSHVAADFLELSVAAALARGVDEAAAVQGAARQLALRSHALVWVTDAAGELLGASFEGRRPPEVETVARRTGSHDGVTVTVDPAGGFPWYAVLPVTGAEHRPLRLYLLSQRHGGSFPAGGFAAGLALIGALVALLAVPLTLRITRPLKRLEESALRIAAGDLSARAELSERDEIGRLARAFNDMAETVERMVRGGRELTANVSHELRSPLARIRVAGECLETAVARCDREDAGEMLEVIREEIEEADRLVGEILQYSRLDLQAPLQLGGRVDLPELIGGVAKGVGPLAKSRGIPLRLELHGGETIAGNEEVLRVAVKNLLENAVLHGTPGAEVLVELDREDQGVRLRITNGHAPLDEQELASIFEPFYRGRDAAAQGSGLGLAIARKVVALHNGDIAACNVPGGFQVRVTLPRARG